VCDSADICPGGDDTVDTDGDAVPDFCDPCPLDNPDDADGDGVCTSDDNCGLFNPGQVDCQPNGIGDTCDIDSGQSFDSNGNGIPDDCELQGPQMPPAPHNATKHRYLSIDPSTNPGRDTTIKVEVAEMRRCTVDQRRPCLVDSDCVTICDNDFDKTCEADAACGTGNCIGIGPCIDVALSGAPLAWFVQQPFQNHEACIPSCGPEDWIARLDKTNAYSEDWSAYDGLVHIGDCAVVPCTTYNVYACDSVNPSVCGEPLVVATQVMPFRTPRSYGDVAGPTDAQLEITPPDGFVSVIDIFAWVLTKQNYGTGALPQAHPTWMDMHGSGDGIPPDYFLTVSDLSAIYIFGFQWGLPWENSQGGLEPGHCP
jgi:hypothetical protein